MKITQHMIEQAAVIANAKVGDELEEAYDMNWSDVRKAPSNKQNAYIGDSRFTYRIKPQPRTVWLNDYGPNSWTTHVSREDARLSAYPGALRIAVEYREVVKE